MFLFIGLIVVLVMVFGSFAISGGNFEIILHAIPHELMTIFGGAVGAYIIANSTGVIKGTFKGIMMVIKGPKWQAEDYRDLLCLMYLVTKTIRSKGVVAIEPHVENPEESKIFQQFPRIVSDHHVVDFICDYVRMMTMNFEDPMQMEDAMTIDLEKHHREEHEPQHSLQTMADGLPAVGIVAAVLGIVKTMAAIAEPVEVLGAMVGSALVGTFLGIFLSYLLVAPIAGRLNQILEQDGQFMNLIKLILVSHLQGNPPQISVEIGRRNVPTPLMPGFIELEEAIAELPPDL
ncbi:flagellar motor stator protein MotA [Kordiimonas marina]|uniref:flagellar motor stator protein MotA n=1 Tax=Kordiimonas marina TaxID=2872312 RepID=UPI001FF17617|nr:flagellar motor stator protein MotA [Kordiimonas marina]MCJ9428895.1 flagellar motor stator protein MotA [Kordiimonas marina]